jgi:glycosyltransferase involved in cell wall biosynthesis
MNILFISTSIPPCQDSQTIRNVYLINRLIQNKHNVYIITGALDTGSEFMIKDLDSNCKVFRTGKTLLEKIQYFINTRIKEKRRYFFSATISVISGWIGIPDNKGDWYFDALKLSLNLIKKEYISPELIVSSSGSFSSNIVAYKIAKKYNIKWVADYGDPWSYSVLKPASLWHIKFINKIIEKTIIKYVNVITVTTDETKKLFEHKILTGGKGKVITIPCGYTEINQKSNFNETNNLSVGYIGTAFKGSRNLVSFLEIFSRIELNSNYVFNKYIIGSYSASFSTFVNKNKINNVIFTGWVSYEKSLNYMNTLDVLVLYGNNSMYQIPGKVYNYLASLKPIVYFCQMNPSLDPTWKILKNFEGVFLVDPNDEDSFIKLANVISDYKSFFNNSQLRKNNELMTNYSWESISIVFSTIIDDSK